MASKKNKTKILVLSHISDIVGGAEMSLLDTFDHWCGKHDIEPEFILRKPVMALGRALEDRGWKYYDLNYTFWSDAVPPKDNYDIFHNSADNAKAILEIEDIIKKSKPDIVMTNSIICPWAALAAYYQGIPHVWFVREYGDLDHGRIFEIGRKETFNDIDTLSELVVTNSQTLADHVKQYVDAGKMTTLYTPFKVDTMRDKLKEGIDSPFKYSNSFKLVMTGSLAPSKGQLQAVEAVGILNERGYNTELCLIGGNASKKFMNELKESAELSNSLDKIHFVGHQTNPFAYIKYADVGIMASRKEAFGRVTFEYLACGKPVVGSNAGATPEIITNEKTGFLYEPGNSSDLADKIMNYAKDRALLEKHAKKAVKSTEDMMNGEFGADALFEKVLKIKGVGKSSVPLNYSHRWLEYIVAAKKSRRVSLKRFVKANTKRVAKKIYHETISVKNKAIGLWERNSEK